MKKIIESLERIISTLDYEESRLQRSLNGEGLTGIQGKGSARNADIEALKRFIETIQIGEDNWIKAGDFASFFKFYASISIGNNDFVADQLREIVRKLKEIT